MSDTVLLTYQKLFDLIEKTVPNAIERLQDDREGLAQLLKLHRELAKVISQADTDIEQAVLRHDFEFGGEQLDGVGYVRIYRKGKRVRYDNDALVSRVAAAMSDEVAGPDPETGEFPPIPMIVERAVTNMADLCGARTQSFNSWRKLKAKDLGIEVDKYSETEGGSLAVNIE